MPLPTLKIEIASQLLNAALRNFFSEPPEYFATICLAGAAEELLGKHVQAKGGESAFTSIQQGALRISKFLGEHEKSVNGKSIAELMNYAKNSSKHMSGQDDINVVFDPKTEAGDLLSRGVTNFYQAMEHYDLKETELICRFNNEYRTGCNVK